MDKDWASVAPTHRRYSPEEKARAVRLVRQLRNELGTKHGTIQRVADQIGCGVESLRTWAKQADIDEGVEAGTTTADQLWIKEGGGWRRTRRSAEVVEPSASRTLPAAITRSLVGVIAGLSRGTHASTS